MNATEPNGNHEESFEITITNGAATMLRKLMNHYQVDSSKQILSMALSILNSVKDGQVIVEKPDGTRVRLTIPSPNKHDGQKEGNA